MNYYEHHIGDYDADTAHLSWVEDMAYTRLMRLYYRKELPIPIDVAEACRLVRASNREQRQAVEAVLKEFFQLAEDGWHQKRCDSDIDRYQRKVDHNRAVGKKGGRPPKNKTQTKPTGLLLGSEEEPKQNPPQSPDTRPYSEAIASGGEPPQQAPKDVVFALGVPLLTAAGVKESNARSFLAMQCKGGREAEVAAVLQQCASERPVQPISWIQDRMNPKAAKGGKHAGFGSKNYREGVTEDGSLA